MIAGQGITTQSLLLVVVAEEVVLLQVQQEDLVVVVLDVEPINMELLELQVKVTVEEKVDGRQWQVWWSVF